MTLLNPLKCALVKLSCNSNCIYLRNVKGQHTHVSLFLEARLCGSKPCDSLSNLPLASNPASSFKKKGEEPEKGFTGAAGMEDA